MLEQSPPVVGFEVTGPVPQRRWTVVLRILLVIPAGIYAAVLSFLAFFATIVIWFGALVMGRAPEGPAAFVGSIVQYLTRVYAYTWLLTDQYPPWSLDGEHAVRVVLPQRGRLNRAAVLFRLVLMIPAGLVTQIVMNGVWPVLIVVWLIMVVTKKMPGAAWAALSTCLRYLARFHAYAAMLAPEYPRGLFGDRDGAATTFVAPPVDPGVSETPLQRQYLVPPVPEPVVLTEPGAQPRIGSFVLSKGAKWLVALIVVLGVIFSVTQSALSFNTTNEGSAGVIQDAYGDVSDASVTFGREVQECALEASGLPCLNAAAAGLVTSLERFEVVLDDVEVPAQDIGFAGSAADATDELIELLRMMATAPDAATYQAAANRLADVGGRFDRSVEDLVFALRT